MLRTHTHYLFLALPPADGAVVGVVAAAIKGSTGTAAAAAACLLAASAVRNALNKADLATLGLVGVLVFGVWVFGDWFFGVWAFGNLVADVTTERVLTGVRCGMIHLHRMRDMNM